MIPSQPEWNATVSRLVNTHSKKSAKRAEKAATRAKRHPMGRDPQRGRPPVAALVEPVSL